MDGGQARATDIGRRRPGRRRGLGLALATLATAAAMLLWQISTRGPAAAGIRDFQVVPYGSHRDLGPARWPAGSPFVLRFTLAQDAYALVFHVDAQGTPTLLFPESRLRAFAGGQPVQVPPENAGEAWLLGDQPGPEWFLLVGSRARDLDLDEVLRRMDAQYDGERTPEIVAAELEELLRTTVGEPRVVRIEVMEATDVSAARPARRSSLY